MLKSMSIRGLRGFATEQAIDFAIPNGTLGSGLTVIVGANNAGKSTIIEALRALAQRRSQSPSFTQGRRNQAAGDEVRITVTDTSDITSALRSVRAGSSETEFDDSEPQANLSKLLILPARRVFEPHFGKASASREQYMAQMGFPAIRTASLDQFTNRLFSIEKNREQFDEVLKEVVDPVPDWSIDQMDNGQYFLKLRKGDITHSSEGLGEGLVSLFYIIDALYDSRDGDTIAVDEPELSLHPALQRKLANLLNEYAKTRQIVVSTHSTYFVGFDALPNGATVARVHLRDDQSMVSQLSSATARQIFGLMQNSNNPHILGLVAKEIFFVEDRVILVEGQEDVVFLKRATEDLGVLEGTFFGWGVGGADNMERIARVLHELGYQKVVGVLDGNRADLLERLCGEFPKFHFFSIPADDIRTKPATPARSEVIGLLDEYNQAVRPRFLDEARALIHSANEYLRGT